MSLDNLISKYLDGELNQEEDTLLRHHLANDKEAKEEFDIAIELHHAMQKDAKSIKAPVDVLSETEDRIMMYIINDSKANVLNLPKAKKSKLNYKYISAAALILFMFAIGKISDYQLGIPAEYAQSYHDEYRSVDKGQAFIQSDNFNTNSDEELLVLEVPKEYKYTKIEKSDIESFNNDIATEGISYSNENIVSQEIFPENKDFKILQSEFDDFAWNDQSNNSYNAMSNSLLNTKKYDEPMMPSILPNPAGGSDFNYYDDMQYQMTTNNVNVSFFSSSDYYNSGFNKKANSAISNYSLSISYTIADNLDFGIEFGKLAYLSEIDVVVTIPKPSGNQMIEVGNVPAEYTIHKTKITLDNELFWVAAFAEHNLIPATDLSWFNLSGRLGFGASNSGSIFYGRVRGKIELYSNLFLTVGTEMRYMYLNFGERNGGINWSRTGFLVYGLEYNLR